MAAAVGLPSVWMSGLLLPGAAALPSEGALELGKGAEWVRCRLCLPRSGVSVAGGGCSSACRCVQASGCPACPPPCPALSGIYHSLRGQQLGRAAQRLPRPVQLLCGALPRSAFATLNLSLPRGVLPALRSRHRSTGVAQSPFIPQNMTRSCVWISSSSWLC